jgi:hypothetical protein
MVFDRERGGSPAPVALARLGSLRECLTTGNNLRALLQSPHLGPKVLAPLLPDVGVCLARWQEDLPVLTNFLRGELQLSKENLSSLERFALNAPAELGAELGKAKAGQLGAKVRLSVERKIEHLLPLMASTIAHLELLVEATHSSSLAFDLEEFFLTSSLSSMIPEHRTVSLVGDLSRLEVVAPARVLMSCLGILAATTEGNKKDSLVVHVSSKDDGVHFAFRRGAPTPQLFEIPVYASSADSGEIVMIALRPSGGVVHFEQASLTIPGARRTVV